MLAQMPTADPRLTDECLSWRQWKKAAVRELVDQCAELLVESVEDVMPEFLVHRNPMQGQPPLFDRQADARACRRLLHRVLVAFRDELCWEEVSQEAAAKVPRFDCNCLGTGYRTTWRRDRGAEEDVACPCPFGREWAAWSERLAEANS